jgi:hypothetical protein
MSSHKKGSKSSKGDKDKSKSSGADAGAAAAPPIFQKRAVNVSVVITPGNIVGPDGGFNANAGSGAGDGSGSGNESANKNNSKGGSPGKGGGSPGGFQEGDVLSKEIPGITMEKLYNVYESDYVDERPQMILPSGQDKIIFSEDPETGHGETENSAGAGTLHKQVIVRGILMKLS